MSTFVYTEPDTDYESINSSDSDYTFASSEDDYRWNEHLMLLRAEYPDYTEEQILELAHQENRYDYFAPDPDYLFKNGEITFEEYVLKASPQVPLYIGYNKSQMQVLDTTHRYAKIIADSSRVRSCHFKYIVTMAFYNYIASNVHVFSIDLAPDKKSVIICLLNKIVTKADEFIAGLDATYIDLPLQYQFKDALSASKTVINSTIANI